MKTSAKGIIALMYHEGIVPGPYKDSKGVWTYGVGHTAAAGDPWPEAMVKGMPDDLDAALVRVFEVFKRDLEKYEKEVAAVITAPMSQHEFDAAVSFHFNTGGIRRANWVKTFNKGDRAKAADQMMNWRKPPEIIERRKQEKRLFRSGVYPSGKIAVWGVGKDGTVKFGKPKRTLSPDEALALMNGAGVPDVEPIDPETPKKLPGIGALVRFLIGLFQKLFGGFQK